MKKCDEKILLFIQENENPLFFILHIENNTPQHSFLKACDQNEKTY
jgi:hypothetical protein